MLYYLFDYIENNFNLPGAGLFQYISFRAGLAAVLSLVITITFGKNLINILRRKQVGEEIRDLGLEGQVQKKGTPTMGGIIIIAAILIPLKFSRRTRKVLLEDSRSSVRWCLAWLSGCRCLSAMR
jgi:phospho-N-acetylmuramoyl-pentapeptide-transferase